MPVARNVTGGPGAYVRTQRRACLAAPLGHQSGAEQHEEHVEQQPEWDGDLEWSKSRQQLPGQLATGRPGEG